ncbi:MAG TPA: hypothetical protein VEC39_02285 [Vicinamibacterales bacterium]|nr:hypothetical protein [Vicinamibacterales bacterium]
MPARFLPILLLLSACATRSAAPAFVAEMTRADALVKEGCYVCLREALAIYERHLTLKPAPIGAAERAFDAALLVAVREKELGIPPDDSLAKARRLVVPARQAVLDASELIIGDTTGLDPDQRAALTGRHRPPVALDNAMRRALDTLPHTDLTAKYVGLTIDCEQQTLHESLDMPALRATYAGVPLMEFRLATCGRPRGPDVGALRANNPRWTDTLYWEGRRELVASLGQAVDFPKASALFAQGRDAFPASLMLMMAWSNVNLAAEEFAAALRGFDDVLARFPTHRDALNGKMQAESYLLKHQDAIATASRLLDLGTWHIGDANYWRAWNRYHLQQYDEAWTDVEAALRGLSNSRVYMLSGLIAYARKTLPVAVDRFDRAFQIDSTACDAVWMSGLVSIDLNDLQAAAPKFTRGMTCFTSSASASRGDATRTEDAVTARGTPATPREQRLIERSRRDAEHAEEKAAQSAYNAAGCYARIGNKNLALTHADVAIAHPKMKDKATALKAAIEKLPN